MSLITCPECKKRISDTVLNCPNCGYRFKPLQPSEILKKEQKRQKTNTTIIIVTFVVIFGTIGLLSNKTPVQTESNSKPSAETSQNTNTRSSTPREVVENSGWDGSVYQVKSWLKNNLKDPKSLEFIEWSPVQKSSEGTYTVRAKYRAKNSFGGYNVENKIFFLNADGAVINTMDYGN
ncbi:MAG: zinc ribbon domain-containing protein [Desulfobacterales bacterium]|nr:zinc ribbon domain-containing protein [Desulfobacterales bacterium]